MAGSEGESELASSRICTFNIMITAKAPQKGSDSLSVSRKLFNVPCTK